MIGEVHQPSVRAQVITRRTYNRPLNDEGTRFERWSDTMDRVIGHQRSLWEDAQGGSLRPNQEAELAELRELGMQRKSLVAGRTLWLGGTEVVKRRQSANFNCSFTEVRTVHDLVDIFWLLLQGCGTGFKPVGGTLSGFTRRMEVKVVRSTRTAKDGDENNRESYNPDTREWTIRIGDSAEAWAKSIGKIAAGKYPAKTIIIDLSQIRPGGSRLRGYGWICSGDRALSVALAAICEIMNRRAGKLLSKSDIWDIVNWLGTVLSSRRSAQIGLVEYGDSEWRDVAERKPKGFDSGPEWFKSQSNNSIVFQDKPNNRQVRDIFEMMVANGGAEPGFVNAAAAKRRAPWFAGLNPSLRAGTKVFTTDGIFPIEELQDKEFTVKNLDGKLSPAKCWLSGNDKPLYEITLKGGHKMWATAEHKWPIHVNGRFVKVATTDLRSGDNLPLLRQDTLFAGTLGTADEGFLLGWIMGDGWVTIRSDNGATQVGMIVGQDDFDSGIQEKLIGILRAMGCNATFHRSSNDSKSYELNTSNACLTAFLARFGYNGKDRLPSSIWRDGSEAFRKGFVDGIFSSDGYVCGAGADSRVGVNSSRASFIRELAELLGFYGLRTAVHANTGKRTFPNGNSGVYSLTSVRMAGTKNVEHFAATFSLSHERKQKQLEALVDRKRWRVRDSDLVKVQSVKLTDLKEDVWDISVADETHCFQIAHCVTGNCGEILLGAFCNLSETDIAKFKNDHVGLHRALRIISRANYRQTVVNLNDGILQSHWHQQNEYLRLCGVGLCGIANRPDFTHYDFRQARYSAIAGAYSMADELGLERPKNVTCIKPGGTIPKCLDTTEGATKPLGRYILNNVSFSRHDPSVSMLVDAGYRVFNNPNDDDSIIATLPVAYHGVDFGGGDLNKETAIEQLERYRMLQDAYVDQNTSITISYDPSEVKDMVKWFDRNWDSYVGVSFLFRNDPTKTAEEMGFCYLPQQVVTREAYEEYVSGLRPIDLESTEGIVSEIEDDCASGACPVR